MERLEKPVVLEFTGDAYRNHDCICGRRSCREIRSGFQSCSDQRGSVFALPTIKNESRKSGLADKKLRKKERLRVHFQLSKNDVLTQDKRQQTILQKRKTRSSDEENERTVSYVACHHFHPLVLERKCFQNGLDHC